MDRIKIYVLEKPKAFFQFNVCLDVRKIAVAQRWCTGNMLVQTSPPHTRTHTPISLLHACMHIQPQMYLLFGRRTECGEQKQCSEADVITKGNTSGASPSLSDPHGGSKSELIILPQNEEIF